MTYYGVNFRSTLAFVTDGADDTWAGLTNSSYPTVTLKNGAGSGWTGTAPSGGNSSNINAANDVRIAGLSALASNNTYKIDLPNGTYDLHMGLMGGSATLVRLDVRIKVGAGTTAGVDQFDIDSLTAVCNNANVMDASGNVWPKANWAANRVPLRVVVTQGFVTILKGPSAGAAISHFSFQEVVTPLADGVLVNEGGLSSPTPVLMEAQPPGHPLGFISFGVGSSSDIDYSLTQADGVTPDPYLDLQTINGRLGIVYKSVRHPGTGPTRTFYVVQTDKTPGKHANSPYVQAITLNVTAAPTKPYQDGSEDAALTSGAFLMKKKVMEAFTVPYLSGNGFGEWPGYTGQTITQAITVYNWAGFLSAMNSLKAQAGANKWFAIEIDNNGTSDWGTNYQIGINGNANGDWLFKPELGGGLLIRYKAGGARPVLIGGFYPRCMRGVHFDDLTPACDSTMNSGGSYGVRCDGGVGGGGELSIVKFSNLHGGFMRNPANASQTPDTLLESLATSFIHLGGCYEQVLIYDCSVGGATDCYAVQGARLLHVKNADAWYNTSDVFPITAVNPTNASTLAAGGISDLDQYEWIEETTARANSNVASGLHPDWRQQRSAAYVGGGTTYILHRRNYGLKGSVNASGSIYQESDTAKIQGAVINNIFGAMGPRGIDIGYGSGFLYTERNSLGPCNAYPDTLQGFAQQFVYTNAGSPPDGGAIRVGHKNILTGAQSYSDGEVVYSGKGSGVDPNSKMAGPFVSDPAWTTGAGDTRWKSSVNDDPKTVTPAQFKAAMIAVFSPKSGVDAGYFGDGPAAPVTGVARRGGSLTIRIGLGF